MIRKHWLRFVLAFLLGFAPVALSAKEFGTIGSTENAVVTTDVGIVTNGMLAGSITASKLVGTDIGTVGTITIGTWHGSSISTNYTDAKLKTITGTASRITIGGTATDPTVDIHTSYVGQSSITTLGTIGTGVWQGTKVAEGYGGTNQSTYTLGDILYSSAANTLSKLPGNITIVKNFLCQTGNGVNSAAPEWCTAPAATMAIGSTVTSGTTGSVLFSGDAVLSQNNAKFFWDNSLWRLGIGLTNPLTSEDSTAVGIEVLNSGGSTALIHATGYGTPGVPRMAVRTSRGTKASPSPVLSGDSLGQFGFSGQFYGNEGNQTIGAILEGKAAENWSLSVRGAYLTIQTIALGDSVPAERFRIGPSGQFGVGGATYGTAGNYFRSGGALAAPTWAAIAASEIGSGAALTKTDDTNVTLTLGGTPTTALLAAASLTLGWTGTLADARIASASTWNGKQAAYTNLTSIGSLADGTGWLHDNGAGTFAYSTPSKSDVGLGSVENTALSTWAGTTNITTLGTIGTGVWQGSSISTTYTDAKITYAIAFARSTLGV